MNTKQISQESQAVLDILGNQNSVQFSYNEFQNTYGSNLFAHLKKATKRMIVSTETETLIEFDVQNQILKISKSVANGINTSPSQSVAGSSTSETPTENSLPSAEELEEIKKRFNKKHNSSERVNVVEKKKVMKLNPNFSEFIKPSCYDDIYSIITNEKQHNIWIYGGTGCGKTELVKHLAEDLDRGFYRINCKSDMTNESFFGGKTVVEGVNGSVIEFKEGIVPTAMKHGLDENGEVVGNPAILYIDEASAMPAHIAIGLNRLLEPTKGGAEICLEEDGGRVVKAHPKFRIICTANTSGRGFTGDNDAIYTAQGDALDESLLNRMSAFFRLGYNKKAERTILEVKIGLCQDTKNIIKFRDCVRKQIKDGELTTPFSTRHIISIADMYNIFQDVGKAIFYAVLENLADDEKSTYNELWRTIESEDLLKKYESDEEMDFL